MTEAPEPKDKLDATMEVVVSGPEDVCCAPRWLVTAGGLASVWLVMGGGGGVAGATGWW